MKDKLLITMLFVIILPIAIAQNDQSHPLSEIKPINTNLDMFGFNITNVTFVGINLTNPQYALDIAGDVRWSGTLQGGNVPWARLTSFPSSCSCPSGYAVQTIGGTCTCIPINATQGVINGSGIVNYIPVFTGVSTIGASPFYLTSNNLNLGQQSLINASWINASYLNVSAGLVVLPSGNVGIGTISPAYKLDVNGDIRASGSIVTSNLVINDNSQFNDLVLYGSLISIFNRDVYQDYLQFNPPNVAEYNDGSGWKSTSIPTSLFRGGIGGSLTINYGWTGYRLTWTNFPYRFLEALYIYYSTSGHSMSVTVETSSDGTTWTTQFTSQSFSGWPGHFIYKKYFNTNGQPYLRITFTPSWNSNYPSNNIYIFNIRYFGAYPGYGSTYLYTWDENRNVFFYGNVGIGTTSPGAKLHIEGGKTGINSSDSAYGQFQIGHPTGGEASLTFVSNLTSFGAPPSVGTPGTAWTMGVNVWGIGLDKFGIGKSVPRVETPYLTIDTSGNVGIGTTSPGEKLDVSGNIKLSGYINVAGSYIRKAGNSIVISDV